MGTRGSRACNVKAKAKEAVKNLKAAVKNPPAYGDRDVEKVDDGTGEVSFGRRDTAVVTTGISWSSESQEEAG
ncbi:MAG: hypothetical protein K8R91_00310 [Phycisphaerae bacterium]|nr:hypothetical protein [Phycisphaerae bacterium]